MSTEKRVIVHFVTKYFTKWGQNVVIAGDGDAFGRWDISRAVRASCHHSGDELVWEANVSVPPGEAIKYRYAVVDESLDRVVKWSLHENSVEIPEAPEKSDLIIEVCDEWTDVSHPAALLSSDTFRKRVLPEPSAIVNKINTLSFVSKDHVTIQFRIHDWEIQEGHQICVTGNVPQLGNWQASWKQVLQMTHTGPSSWSAEITVDKNSLPIVYKYAFGKFEEELVLEQGESRIAALPSVETDRDLAVIFRYDGFLRRELRWRGAGLAVPVFSLRTSRSVGCGEFADISEAVNLCNRLGFRILQILPVSDTSVTMTWRDSYPYSSLCVFALHPMYVCLERLSSSLPNEIMDMILKARKSLNLAEIDYEGTMNAKLSISRKIFDLYGIEEMNQPEYKNFWERNKDWLGPYSVFCLLRQVFGTSEHWKWGLLSCPDMAEIERLSSPGNEWYGTIQFHRWLQYHLHCQLVEASGIAKKLKVVLKGDLPIGVDKRSVDTWLYPKLFRMNASTGAPPDVFDPTGGQNWGFPTYNWEEMEKENFGWWQRRLSHMAQYFSAYRIDHVLGFFRIWELPANSKTGLLGRFRPSIPLHRSELEALGIWDFKRLCEPYITRKILLDVFEDCKVAAEVIFNYLEEGPHQRYVFQSKYNSEALLWELRPSFQLEGPAAAKAQKIWLGLIHLRQNVVLLQDPENANHFYPRFDLMSTRSFKELNASWQESLKQLHDDYFHGGRSDSLWSDHAKRTLPALQNASDMLVCGEDLGMIPACVHPVMEELGILSLRIQRMPPGETVEFDDPGQYPYMSVASPSSHDTPTLRAWYEEDLERQQRFRSFLEDKGFLKPSERLDTYQTPTKIPGSCTPDIIIAILRQHLESPSALCIFPLQDIMAIIPSLSSRPAKEEVINDPSNSEHYWRYWMHVTLEDLQQNDELTETLKNMVVFSGR